MQDGGAKPWSHVVATLRFRYFLPLWSSNLIYYCAMAAQMVTLHWLVTSLTDSRLGLVGFVQGGIMFLASPIAGVAIDRFSGRHILMLGRIGMTSVLLALATLVALERIEIWHILVSAVAAGLWTALLEPVTQTFIFDLVDRERAQNAVGLNAAASSLAQTVGPFMGGILLGSLGFVGAYLSAASGLVLAAAVLLLVPVLRRSETPSQNANWGADLREVLSYVTSHRPVLLVLVACSMAIFNGALFAMRPIFARHVLQVGSFGFGAMAAAAGLGGIAGAVVIAGLPRFRRAGLTITISMLGFATTIFLYSFAFSYEYILALEFISGVFGQFWMVSTYSGLQMAVPEAMRGRVISLVVMLVMLSSAGYLFVGLLADALGDQFAMGIFGLIPMIVLSVLLLFGYRSLSEL